MNIQTLYKYIDQPEMLDQSTLTQVEELVREYPWLQAARMLLLKNLSNLSHPLFLHELPVTSAYTTNREVLYHFIHNKPLSQKELHQPAPLAQEPLAEVRHSTPKAQKGSTLDFEIIEPVLFNGKRPEPEVPITSAPQDVQDSKKVERFVDAIPDFSYEPRKTTSKEEAKTTPLDAQTGNNEVLSFNDWLQKMTEPQQLPKEKNEEKVPTNNSQWDILDSFIDNYKTPERPAKTVILDEALEDLSEIQTDLGDDFVTETLANIYIKQEKYKKAIKTFNKLSLKYPEKSTYFAGRIKKVKKKLKKNK